MALEDEGFGRVYEGMILKQTDCSLGGQEKMKLQVVFFSRLRPSLQ